MKRCKFSNDVLKKKNELLIELDYEDNSRGYRGLAKLISFRSRLTFLKGSFVRGCLTFFEINYAMQKNM